MSENVSYLDLLHECIKRTYLLWDAQEVDSDGRANGSDDGNRRTGFAGDS
jgi:hypothetical protein